MHKICTVSANAYISRVMLIVMHTAVLVSVRCNTTMRKSSSLNNFQFVRDALVAMINLWWLLELCSFRAT